MKKIYVVVEQYGWKSDPVKAINADSQQQALAIAEVDYQRQGYRTEEIKRHLKVTNQNGHEYLVFITPVTLIE